MIPLLYFLIAWLVLIGILGIVAILVTVMMLRYGVAGPGTTGMTFIFFAVGLVVTLSTCAYLTGVDWDQHIDLTNTLKMASPLSSPYSQTP